MAIPITRIIRDDNTGLVCFVVAGALDKCGCPVSVEIEEVFKKTDVFEVLDETLTIKVYDALKTLEFSIEQLEFVGNTTNITYDAEGNVIPNISGDASLAKFQETIRLLKDYVFVACCTTYIISSSGYLHYANLAAFPGSGTDGILYIAEDSNVLYWWDVADADYEALSGANFANTDLTLTGDRLHLGNGYSYQMNLAEFLFFSVSTGDGVTAQAAFALDPTGGSSIQFSDSGTGANSELTMSATGSVLSHIAAGTGLTNGFSALDGVSVIREPTELRIQTPNVVATTATAGQFLSLINATTGKAEWATVTGFTVEGAQDAVGAMVDTTLVYVDATPLLTRAALTGAITAAQGSNTTALGSFTKAQLDSAVSDGNVLYVGDITQYTDELAQDAIGLMTVDGTLVYVDGTPSYKRAPITGDIAIPDGSNTSTLASVIAADTKGAADKSLTIQYDVKGRLLVVTENSIAITEAQVTNLVADLALKAPLASPALTGNPTAPTQAPADNSTKIATTAYVDNAVLGQRAKEAVKYASIAALPAIVYANGASGVGATLTGVAFGALGIDSGSPAVGERVLIKNQASTFQNGAYTVTATGSGIAVFVLTRAIDFDQAVDIQTGDIVFVTSGTTLSTTTWTYNGIDNPVMGTDAITWAQTAGQGSFTGGNGITITGVSIAIDTNVTVDKTTAQVLTNKDLSSGTNTFPSTVFTALTDTPGNYTSAGNKVVGVNSGATALEYKLVRSASTGETDIGGSAAPTDTWLRLAAPTTGKSNLRITGGTKPTTPVDDDVWAATANNALFYQQKSTILAPESVIWVGKAVTVGNTVTETSLLSALDGNATLGANFLTIAKTILVRIEGFITNTGTPTMRAKIKLGGVTVIDTTALTMLAITGTTRFWVEGIITVRTTGAGGTVFGQGGFHYYSATNAERGLVVANNATSACDTTASLAIDVSIQWGTANAANTLTVTNGYIEILY